MVRVREERLARIGEQKFARLAGGIEVVRREHVGVVGRPTPHRQHCAGSRVDGYDGSFSLTQRVLRRLLKVGAQREGHVADETAIASECGGEAVGLQLVGLTGEVVVSNMLDA